MKFVRFFMKLFIIFFAVFFIGIGVCFLYVKLSPKIMINSANNIVLYDSYDEVFFKGSI